MKTSTQHTVTNEQVKKCGAMMADADIKAEGSRVASLIKIAPFVSVKTIDTFGRGMKARLEELEYASPAVTVSQYKGALLYIIGHPKANLSGYTLTELYDLGKATGATANTRKAGRKPLSKQVKCNNAIAKLVKQYGAAIVRKATAQV